MTAQAADVMILDGAAYPLHSTPLENYFKRAKWRPKFTISSTGNYRGYVARWEIFGIRLFLTGLFGRGWIIPQHLTGKLQPDPDPFDRDYPGTKSLRLSDMFPETAPLVPARWVTQRLVVPVGPRLIYCHAAFQSLHARYCLINVVQGRVGQIRQMDGYQWARRTRPHWPEDWYRDDPETLVTSDAVEEDDGELPDWREQDNFGLRCLLYGRAQEVALERPCGAVPSR